MLRPGAKSKTLPGVEYRYLPLNDKRDMRIIVLEPAEQRDAPLKCQLEHRLWISDHVQSAQDSKAHCALMKWEMEASRHRMESAKRTGNDEQYLSAKRVLVWLGDDYRVGEPVVRFLLQVHDDDTAESIQCKLHETTGSLSLQPLQEILLKPWFHRRWTIQEVVLGRQVIMICRTESIKFVRFYRALHHLYSVWQSTTAIQAEVFERLRTIYRLREHGQLTGRVDLLKLLVVFHEADCSDPFDRIYSMLAFGNRFTRMFQVSYEMNYGSYLKYFAGENIICKNLPAVLSSAGAFSSTEGLPSYVPDWRVRRQYLPLFIRSTISTQLPPLIQADSMSLHGFVVGKVYQTGPAAPIDPSFEALARLLQDWWHLYFLESPKATAGITDFLSTLSAGKISKNLNIDLSDEIFGNLGNSIGSESLKS